MEKKEKTNEAEMEALKRELAEAKRELKYKPKPTPIPENQEELPAGIQDAKIKTKVTDLSTVIKEKMLQLKDLATLEVLMDTNVRMRNRLESIKKETSARSLKIRNKWKTYAPSMHVSNLEGKKISNDEYEISFGVFIVDEKGNKKLFTHSAEHVMHDGSKVNRVVSAEYRIGYEVVETIKTGKPITREVMKINMRD